MSQTNIPIRTLASPLEYQKIKLQGSDQLHQLLGALLIRKELAAQIQELNFEATGSANTGESALYDNVDDFEDRVDDAINTAAQGVPEWFTEYWRHNIFLEPDEEDDASDLSSAPPVKDDAVLALVLCLATNLEQLDLTITRDGAFPITRDVLGLDWRLASGHSNAHRPFHKLKDLRLSCRKCRYGDEFNSYSWVPITDSLQNVSLNNLSRRQSSPSPWPCLSASLHHGLGTRLHTLEIRDVYTRLPEIKALFSRPCFWALKRLKLSTLLTRDSIDDEDIVDGFELSFDIVIQFPHLEYLEITNAPIGCGTFGSFAEHESLVEMVVDYHLLEHDSGNTGRLHYPHEILPPNLRSLELTNIKSWGYDGQLKKLINRYRNYARKGTDFVTFIDALFGANQIRKFDLHLDMEQRHIARPRTPGMQAPEVRVDDALLELSNDQYDIFRQMIETGTREGVEIGIWRHGAKYPKRLLLAPDHVLPWPHCSDVDREHWHRENEEWWKFKNNQIDVTDLEEDHHENWDAIESGYKFVEVVHSFYNTEWKVDLTQLPIIDEAYDGEDEGDMMLF
ncbi:uncharacterized protein N0V89_006348 [Didymosphaeria variabile]|uniref:Uncharacterized protein n=1 Tax=Didymosphaeria variabile TaxID=1932322 RepID=A0A9W8XN26_9PLEO|nr:uncharacterized protein N0V89_006348 [Didymosphaeria variabile]KAJ4354611.1 hypothetical protein N0V89_006348 [Didymosphaeria variabile]